MAKTVMISCPNCKYEGNGKRIVKGSFWIEVILWLCFIVPGLIYSLWRLTNKKWVCPRCSYEYVIKM